ncbi:hypothetical protein [Limnohabitans sp.]|uniref:hypothetical protein n=1 Tax=Limnohabitans sp. TaxID=1907725 RepID=UPI00311F54B8
MRYLQPIIKTTVVLFSSLNLLACSSLSTLSSHEYEDFIALESNQRVINVATVTWQAVDNATETCRQIMLRGQSKEESDWAYITPPLACSVWSPSKKTCTILPAKRTNHTILGHELRHCFEGQFHSHPSSALAKRGDQH